MFDLFILLTPLLVLPIVLLFAFLGCTIIFPPQEEESEWLQLYVEVRFPPPEDISVDDLVVDVEIRGVTLEGDEVPPDIGRGSNPQYQDDGKLLYVLQFPAMEGRYTVICNVYNVDSGPVIRSPNCPGVVSRELGGPATVQFDAEVGDRVFTCGGV